MSSSGTQAVSLHDTLQSAWSGHDEYDGLAAVIGAIAEGATQVERLTRQAALAGVLGSTGETNVQGEIVQRLDAEGTQTFVDALRDCGHVAALACEELEAPVFMGEDGDKQYIVLFDPVDGSSNIDVAVTIGSIFAIYKRQPGAALNDAALLRPGREQIAAAYTVYGSSTVLVVATALGVDGFTLDPESGAFVRTHPNIRIPEKCAAYSVNEGNHGKWEPAMQAAVAELRHYGLRYVGSLVADFHRDLLKGGIFLYPGDVKSAEGKLRLGYEANPLCFVAEQAGGAGSTGRQRILDVVPEKLHQRTPLVVGNADVVRAVEERLSAGA